MTAHKMVSIESEIMAPDLVPGCDITLVKINEAPAEMSFLIPFSWHRGKFFLMVLVSLT